MAFVKAARGVVVAEAFECACAVGQLHQHLGLLGFTRQRRRDNGTNLRAWQHQSLIGETLVERYDADWWRNPRCGPWMVETLFGEAQRELAHEQAMRVSGKSLSFAPLVRKIEQLLA